MYFEKRQNKYKNIRQDYGGRNYHSKKEAAYAQELDLRYQGKEIAGWEPQHKVELRVHGRLICNYYVDFLVYHIDGSTELVEVKGFETEVWRLKWKLLEAIYNEEHPDIKLTIVR